MPKATPIIDDYVAIAAAMRLASPDVVEIQRVIAV